MIYQNVIFFSFMAEMAFHKKISKIVTSNVEMSVTTALKKYI